ncbi:MAG: DUF177 domain-containing protein [Sulfuriflexus sp.]|nr:DUF177 domain-containing protein [Sulfuriflexus sp.]
MKDRLPEHIEPLRLARSQRLLHGRLPLSRMPRLASSLEVNEEDAGEIDVDLKFDVDVTGIAWMEGHLTGTLTLCCQRCMQQLFMPIDATFKLAMVESESEIEQLGEQYEPLLLEDDSLVSVVELVEDELLLTLPIVPKHDTEECNAGEEIVEQVVVEVKPESKKNPFAALADLKSK